MQQELVMGQEFKVGDIVSVDYVHEYFDRDLLPISRPHHLVVKTIYNIIQRGFTPAVWNYAEYILSLYYPEDLDELYAHIPSNLCRKIDIDKRPAIKTPMGRSW
jgi:hypothetical protein